MAEKLQQPESTYENGADEGDFKGISNINPDDIESISVLTGAADPIFYRPGYTRLNVYPGQFCLEIS